MDDSFRVPFHVPSIDESDIPGVLETLRAKWVTTGQRCRDFEAAFSEFLLEGESEELHAVAVNSGTAALHLALEAAGVGPGDRVVVPVWTFTASAEVVRYLGADPLFVDVSEDDFALQPNPLRERVRSLDANDREKIRAVIPVHFAGRACDMNGLEALATEEAWAVVDDAAHGLPTRHAGRWIGRWGHATAFSFYATKTLCTGEGGMVVTANPEMAERMRIMRLHGISRDAFDRYRSERPAWAYEVVAPGFKYNLSDLMAALGNSQLPRIGAFRDARAEIARRYDAAFGPMEGLTLPPHAANGDRHAWHLYALRVDGGRAVRDAFIQALADEGVATSVHFIPLHLQPYWRDRYRLSPEDFPAASRLFDQEVSLPIYPSMRHEQIDRVIEVVPRAYEKARQAGSPGG